MNKDILRGQWNQMRGKVKARWGKLTDDDLVLIQGNRDTLTGKIQEYYGRSRDEAREELDRWLASARSR